MFLLNGTKMTRKCFAVGVKTSDRLTSSVIVATLAARHHIPPSIYSPVKTATIKH